MSICNVWVERDRVLVAVDTATQTLVDSSSFEASKFLHFTSQNVLLASRGHTRFLMEVFAGMWGQPNLDAMELVPIAGLDAGLADYVQRGQAAGVPISEMTTGVDLVFAGWSHKRDRMAAICFQRPADATTFTKREMTDGNWLAPNAGWSDSNPPPQVDDAEKMMGVARQQVEFVRRESLGGPIGGRLIVAELTRRSVTVTDLGPI